jgi:hypothetical protein
LPRLVSDDATWAEFCVVSANASEGMKFNIDNLLWPEIQLIKTFPILYFFILYFCNGDIMEARHNIHCLFLVSNWRPFQLARFDDRHVICRVLLVLADYFQVELKSAGFNSIWGESLPKASHLLSLF